jgi:hypothetical protein
VKVDCCKAGPDCIRFCAATILLYVTLGYGLNTCSRIRFLVGAGNFFFFTTTSRMALGPTQPPIQWLPGALSLGVKQLVHEADHSPPSSAKVKE